ncbi:MAG: leucyl aminopeptidase [Acidimicrobiales bacterium]
MTRILAVASVPAGVDVVVVPVWAGRRPVEGNGVEVDVAYLEARGFDGRVGETLALAADKVAVGMGPAGELTADGMRRAAANATRALGTARRAAFTLLAALDSADAAQALAEGIVLASYAYTAQKSSAAPRRLDDALVVARGARLKAAVQRGTTVGAAVCAARDLINEPAGTLTPTRLASVAARQPGLTVTALTQRQLQAARMGGLLGVARGSEQPPRLIELLYEPTGATASTPTVAFVGKGITFDSGGLSLKTGQGMMTMKTDMSGAAAVIAAMGAIATLGAPVRVLGLCPATENMPSGAAIRPGDVLRTRSGTTVEVLNTDAEGRLVLADGLALAVEAGVDAIVDIATLTGAVSTALGRGIAGLMGNDDEWVAEVRAAAGRAGESAWHLPLPAEYRREIDSEVADIKNIGTSGMAGTLIAGLFLNEFVGAIPWAHLDIAGTARSESEDGYTAKGGTGWGVRSLVELAVSGRIPKREGATRRARWKGKTPAAQLARS